MLGSPPAWGVGNLVGSNPASLTEMKKIANRIFYGPGDWLVAHTDRRGRAAINFWLLILWFVPGIFIWFLLRDALWFVGFMSIYAIWTGHLGALSAETPVENEVDIEADHVDVDIRKES